jgi:hypothetical protein
MPGAADDPARTVYDKVRPLHLSLPARVVYLVDADGLARIKRRLAALRPAPVRDIPVLIGAQEIVPRFGRLSAADVGCHQGR